MQKALNDTDESRIFRIMMIWVMWYGMPISENELKTIASVLLWLKRDVPKNNPYWTLSDLDKHIKKTYLDIQKAVKYLEEKKFVESGKRWVTFQGNKRYIKLTWWGNDFLKTCELLAKKEMDLLSKNVIKKDGE